MIDNNELLDFLSRVPSDVQVVSGAKMAHVLISGFCERVCENTGITEGLTDFCFDALQ